MSTETMIWTVTDRLRKSRELVGLDTAEMGQALGVARTTISRWENGRTVPRRSDLIAWGMVTGFRWQWLADGLGEPMLLERTRRDSNPQPSDLESGQWVLAA